MANQVASVVVNGTINYPNAIAQTVGIGTSLIRSIEPYIVPAAGQPLPGITILTVIKMQKNGNDFREKQWLSPTATATVITSAT